MAELAPIITPPAQTQTPTDPTDGDQTSQTGLSAFVQQINQGVPQKPTVSKEFQNTQSVPVVEKPTYKDLTTYKPYIDDPNPEDPNLDLKRADAQSGFEQTMHGVGQFGENLAGGFLQALGTNLDVHQALNTMNQTQQEYGNAITNLGEELSKNSQENFPIYQKDASKFNPSDPGWWASQLGQAGTMVGMAGEAVAETAAVAAATEGSGVFEEVGNLARKFSSIRDLGDLMNLGTNTERLKTSATLFGLINRHNMSMMSASDAGKEEYEKLIGLHYTEEQARQYAAKAASATYYSQLPLVALDILGFKAMTFNPVTSAAEGGLADSIVEGLFGHIKNEGLKTAAIIGAESAKGSFEGMWQYLASEEGKSYADRLATGAPNNVGERLNEYIKDSQLVNVAASGFIGGAVSGAIFKGYENLTQGSAKRELDNQYKTFVDGIASMHVDLANRIAEADKIGNEVESNNLRRQLGINKALSAVHLDNIKGEDVAFSGYKNYFQKLLEAANSNDTDTLSQMGLGDRVDFIKQNVPNYLADADKIKSIYDETKESNKPDSIVPITFRKYLLDNLNDTLADNNTKIAALRASLPDLNNLSATGAEIYSHQMDIKNTQDEINSAVQRLKDPSLKPEEAEGWRQALSNLNLKLAFSKEKLEGVEDHRTGIEKSVDNDISQSLDNQNRYQQLLRTQVDIQTHIDATRKTLNIWQDPKFQSAKQQDKIRNIIKNANSSDELDRATQALDRKGLLTEELSHVISDKKKDVSAKEEVSSLKNKVDSSAPPISQALQSIAPKPEPNQEQPVDTVNPFGRTIAPTEEDLNKPASLSDIRKNLTKEILPIGDGGNVASTKVSDATKDLTTLLGTDEQKANDQKLIDDANQRLGKNTVETLPINPSKISSLATIVADEGLFDPAKIVESRLTDKFKDSLKEKLQEYISSLTQDLGQKPDFKALVEDFINHTTKDQTERNFNLLKVGWELNGNKANYDQVYNELFADRKAKGLDFFDFGAQVLTDDKELAQANSQLATKHEEKQADLGQTKITADGDKVFKHLSPYKTVASTLKFGHLSFPYIKTLTPNAEGEIEVEFKNQGTELNQPDYVDSKDLMNPNKYNAGTKMQIKVPENADDILVSQWDKDFNKLKPIKFGDWAKDKDKTSDEYLAKLPMIIYDKDGNGKAFVHDTDWYNPTNIGYAEDREQQAQIIKDSQRELMELRRAIMNNDAPLDIEITEKRPGTLYRIPEDQPTMTIDKANPDSKIGYVNDTGNIVTSDGVVNFEDLINKDDLKRGHKYNIVQAGLNPDGKPTYFASKMMYDKIDTDAKMSIIQALRTYASQNDIGENLSKKSDVDDIRKQVLSTTGLDLYDKADLEKYLNMFIPTVKEPSADEKGVYANVENNPAIANMTPFMAVQKGAIVYGIKGINIDGKSPVNYFYPGMLKGNDPAKAASYITSMLKRISQDDFLGKMSQNMDGDALQNNRTVAHIEYNPKTQQRVITDQGKYDDYLKGRLKTNLKQFDLGDGTHASFLQPVINYTYDKQVKALEGKPEAPKPNLDIVSKIAQGITGKVPETDEAALLAKVAGSMDYYKSLGLTPDAIQALSTLSKKDGGASFDPDYKALTDEIVQSVKTKLTKIQDLDTTDRGAMVGFIANEIMNKIDPQKRNSISKDELIKDVNKSFENLIGPKVGPIDEQIQTLTSLMEKGYPELQGVVDQLNTFKGNADILKKNWNYLINEAFDDYISKFTGITIKVSRDQANVDVSIEDADEPTEIHEQEDDQQELKIESGDQRDKSYSKETVEDNGKNSVSYLLKRFLAQIPSYDKTGNEKKGYMGVTLYPGFDHTYDSIGSMLSSSGGVISDYDDMKLRLSQFAEAQPWVNEVIKRLDASDQQLKNAFMYNFTRDGLTMKFVMTSFNTKTGSYGLKVYDTNANEIKRVIQTQWKENFKQSPLVIANGENYEVNSGKAQQLLAQFDKWNETKKYPDAKTAKEWLSNFGIDVSMDTIKDLMSNGYYVSEGKKKDVKYPYTKMFSKSGTTNGLFGRLAKYLEAMSGIGINKDFNINDAINPFSDTSGILNKLSNLEAKHSTQITTNSFRDGDKSIFGFTPGKYAVSMVNSLKSDPNIITTKQQISYDRGSFLLNLLANDADFSSKFGIDHLGINAFKELGKKLYQNNSITSLSDADHELVKLGMFQDSKQGTVKSKTPEGLDLRMARMFLPTMSDKSQMLNLTTAVLSLKAKDIEVGTDTISDPVKHFLFSQLVQPELDRIISHHSQAIKSNTDPNFLMNEKGYNMAAQIFHFIPEMNNLMYKQENGESIRLIEFLSKAAPNIDDKVREEIINKIRPDADTILSSLFKNLVANKMDAWEKAGYIERDKEDNISNVKFLDNSYLNKTAAPTEEEKVKMAAYDYIVNSVVTNANMHMLVAGDIANYSQDKAFKEGFEKDEKGNPIPFRPLDNNIYSKIESDVIGVNLGKRLALLIAPGSSIAQSKDDKYIQLFAKDRVSASENMGFLIGLYHGKDVAGKNAETIKELKSDDPKVAKAATDKLAKKFPDLAAYLAIESTDAQELTTAKEQMDIMYRQGRIDTETYKDMSDRLIKQSALTKKGLSITPDLFLTDDELKLVFQPQKPVVTGQMPDVDKDMSRMIYIKSSAFPLIPQMTQAFPELDKVRQGMENVQDETGKNVRLSYDTANKVGSVLGSNQIQLWDNQGNYIDNAIDPKRISQDLDNRIPGSALLMDRNNFRIQQDVPFKSTKIDHQDTTTLGTQMMKEIFGDGVGQIKDKIFDYNGQKVSGTELQNQVNEHFNNWIANEKTSLYDQVGINEETGQPYDITKTTQKLQGLLEQEAKKRGYPRQDIDALETTTVKDADGNIVDSQFTIPLWLSPNSNRYEALLNAIVTNRLLNLDLPGASFVAGSQEGFKVSDDTASLPSKTIFTDKWKGELQPATFDEKGNLLKAQVLMPSKFRDKSGKLLDLFQKKGSEYVYVTPTEGGGWNLKEDMIDDVLKNNTTFRIPTSSHVSMSQIELAGFLPPESGDLMIVPKNFTKQKGLDFDVDKENMYMLHHTLDENGKVIPIDKAGTDLKSFNEDYNDLTEGINAYQERVGGNVKLQNLINQYKDEIEVSKEMGIDPSDAKKFIKQLKTELNPDFKRSELKDLIKVQKGMRDLKSKLLQNEIAKGYSSILGSSDERVQRKINKVLSTDFAEDQANLLDSMVNTTKDTKNFTILSDEYQKNKMGLGAAGKLGIGVYSNYVVFHSLVQQADRPIRLMKMEYSEEAEKMIRVPYNLRIGDIKSDGLLGRLETLDGSRSIADVNAERQNTATDNEKLQIMGKTNTNELTINVDATLSALGFDKDNATINGEDKEISIPYFLLSQPIIRDYVDQMRNVKSNIAEYNPNAELDVINNLNKKYSDNGTLDVTDSNEVQKLRNELTGQKLADNITDGGKDGMSQQAVLHLFREVKEYGDQLTGLQSKTNVQRNGLGKSMFEMLDKYNNVAKLQNAGLISNTDRLIGDYISGDDYINSDPEELKAQGYTIFSDPQSDNLPFAVKPTTVTGSLIVHSAQAGYELWAHYFPHRNPIVSKMIDDVIKMTSSEGKNDAKRLQLQYEVFDEMKKYLYSSSSLGLFKGNPQDERERLFFDRNKKESLAGYLNKYTKSEHENVDLVANNKLVSRFTYQLEKGLMPSIIKYDNSKSEDFNEEYKYQALVELMDKNAPLADFQNEPYTTRMLAKDLINYSYLSGGIQEAIQFVKYIPVPYLKEMGFSDATQLWQRAANGENFINSKGENIDLISQMLGTTTKDLESTEYPRFLQQYVQHNPGRLTKLTEDNIDPRFKQYSDGKSLANLVKFRPKDVDDSEPKAYISIYNPDVPVKNKFQIYKWDGDYYNRIPTLGAFGLSEYSIRDNNVTPLIDKAREPIAASLTDAIKQDKNIQEHFYDIDKGDIVKTLKSISEDHLTGLSEVADKLLPYLNNNIKLELGDVNGGRSRGLYKGGTIMLDNTYLANSNTTKQMIASTVIHEAVHALTSDRLNNYFDKQGNFKVPIDEMPPDINRMARLYREVTKQLGTNLDEFKEWYIDHPGQVRNKEDRFYYAGLNIHEFTAMIMSEPDIQQKMAGLKYLNSGKTLLDQFKEVIKKVLNSLGIKFDENSVTAQGIDSAFQIIDTEHKEQNPSPSDYFSSFGNVINSTGDEHIQGLIDQSDTKTNDEDENSFMSPEERRNLEPDCIF